MNRDQSFLLHAYRRMLLIRKFEEQAVALSAGAAPLIAGSIHPCAGQEAIPVGAMAALNEDDRVLATYRGHGWVLESGVTPFELLAEMAHRSNGLNGGRAGSLLAMAPKRGLIGENSIVGAGGPIACGVAIASRVQNTGRVVIVSFGDGAMSQGGLHEAMVMAGALKLPMIFMCENNGWAEMTPASYAAAEGALLKRAEGCGLKAVAVDGCDAEAVHQAVSSAAAAARAGEGATFIEAATVRLWGHYNRDIEHYRSKADRMDAQDRDPILRLRTKLLEAGVEEATLAGYEAEIAGDMDATIEQVRVSPEAQPETVSDHVYASSPVKDAVPAAVERSKLTYAQAANRALHDSMESDASVIMFGEDLAKPGGVYGVTRNLLRDFGPERVFDTPIAETAILGSAVGAAMDGLRPVVEIMFADFLFVCLDQLVNQAANLRYVSNGAVGIPIVVRTQQGVTPGSCAQHGQSVEAFLAHVPGLRVGLPVTPQDAYSMLRVAIADADPTIIIEARSLYGTAAEVDIGGPIEGGLGAVLTAEGDDLAIITWGTSVPVAEKAAELLKEEGISCAVLNLRWLSPLDRTAIDDVVAHCGRVLVVHEANRTGGFGAEIAAQIAERHFDTLKGAVARLGTIDVPMPAAPILQKAAIPTEDKIVALAKRMLAKAPADIEA